MSTGPLLALRLDRRQPLGLQIEAQLRTLIRSEGVSLGSELPSTRALARDLGVSRGVVVGAYAQLAAEGYLALRRGAAPLVAAHGLGRSDEVFDYADVPVAWYRYNLRPDLPDFALFPRTEWLAASRAALQQNPYTDLAYGEPFGARKLRSPLAQFLARTRGVVATPDRTSVVAGSTQALFLLASALRRAGADRIAVEDPGHRWRTRALRASGLEVVPARVDGEGLCVDELPDVAGVVASPDHHFPSGVAMSPDRRRALVEWAAAGDRLVIEHDYDGHFRYDRLPAGALQGLAPEHVAYVGSASPLLVPTLRVGWAVLPARWVVPFADQVFATAIATPRITQLALAETIERGYLDRHLRKVRSAYRRRREVLVSELERRLPDVTVSGAPAGLFVSLSLAAATDEAKLLADARERGLTLDGVGEHTLSPQPPGLVIGFAGEPEPTLKRAARELAAVVLA